MSFDELCSHIQDAKAKAEKNNVSPKAIYICKDLADLLYQNGVGSEIYGMEIRVVNTTKPSNFMIYGR